MNLPPRKVTLIVHAPRVPELQNQHLYEALGWNQPDALIKSFIHDLRAVSDGHADFQIVSRYRSDQFPRKNDGFRYTPKTYLSAIRGARGFHHPDAIDYPEVLEEFELLEALDSDLTDEIWLMGFPYAGYFESTMGGPDAFWCNAPPLPETAQASRRFVVMGFNYERGVGEMLESFGHRAESIMQEVFRSKGQIQNDWARFTRYDLTHPGKAEVGTIHFAPNSQRDYDWGNRRKVRSNCDAWLTFPPLRENWREVDCREWGNGDIRAHHRWWFQHLPKAPGETNGVRNNWWAYILNPELVRR
jgi:hypothetical protein